MSHRGFSLTRFLLVIVCLGALVEIGRIVNPVAPQKDEPKPAPPPAQTAAKAKPTPTLTQKDIHELARKRKEMLKAANNTKRPPTNPQNIEIVPDWYVHQAAGATGQREVEHDVVRRNAEYEKYVATQPKKSPAPLRRGLKRSNVVPLGATAPTSGAAPAAK